MATIGVLRELADKFGGGVPFVILNDDGDEVPFEIKGYDEDEDQIVVVVSDFDVPAPTNTPIAETISVTVPKGVEVKVYTEADPSDDDE